MSQAKVDRYKEQKANRKQIVKKEKAKRLITNICAAVVAVGIIGWIGYSSYSSAQADKEVVRTTVEADTTAIDDFLNGLEE